MSKFEERKQAVYDLAQSLLDAGYIVAYNPDHTWLHFSNGDNVVYAQSRDFDYRTFSISSVYHSSKRNGTGAQLAGSLSIEEVVTKAPYLLAKVHPRQVLRNPGTRQCECGRGTVGGTYPAFYDDFDTWFMQVWNKDDLTIFHPEGEDCS